jgi:dienelactone hydrolase
MSCPNCFTGGISTVKPTGTETAIHGLPTYVAQPPDGVPPKALVIFLPDAFGWDFVNNRVLCDTYAREGGFLVWLPDFMNGDAPPKPAPFFVPICC